MFKRCAYCTSRETGKAVFVLGGHPACASCFAYFGDELDQERLARVRSYQAQRRSLVNRVVALSR